MSERKDSSSTTKSNNNAVDEPHALNSNSNSQIEIQHSGNNNKNNNSTKVPLMLQMTPIASENNRLTIHGAYAFEPPRQGHVAVDAIRILMGNTSAGKALLSEEIKKSGFHEKKTWPRPPSTSDSAEMLALHRSNSNNHNNNNSSVLSRRPQTSTNTTKQPKTPQNSLGNGNSTARSMRNEQTRLSQWTGTGNNTVDENHQVPPTTSRPKNPKLEMPDIPSEKVRKLKMQEELEASISFGSDNHNNNAASLVVSTSTASPNKNTTNGRNCPKLFQNCVADSSALIYSAAMSSSNNAENNNNNNNSSQQKLPPSRVPRQYWITREHAIPQTVAQSEEQGGGVKTNFEMVSIPIFPSEKPVSRMELFALSKTLDEMMASRVGPAGFDLLQNAEAALSTFSETRGVEDEPGAMQKTKDYIETVKTVADIVDVGICEVVRHTAAGCIERGALLDQLRGMLVAMFGNLCDRAENDMSRMHRLRLEIHEAEKERDLARQEASNWRRLFFKVNSIGGTSSTKGVTGLLGDPNANPRNLLLQRQKNKDNNEDENDSRAENKNAIVMPSEEECKEKSFDEIQDEVYRRLDNAAAEEKRLFEEKRRQKEIAKERRRKEEELWEAAARRPSGVFDDDDDDEENNNNNNNNNNYQDDVGDEEDNRKVSPSRRVSFQVQSQSQQPQLQMSNRRRSVTISSTLSPSTSDFPQQQINNSNAPSRRGSLSVSLCKAPQTSRTFGNFHQHHNQNKFANFKDEDDEDDDNNETSRGRKIDEVDLERDAVFQWIEEQFAKRTYAARDLALAAEKHLEIIRKHEAASLTSALGDMPIEDDADALEAELAQQPKSIYQVLVNLLTDVHSAVMATDSLSSRMSLDGLHLKHPERNINVAVRRWRRLAQEIGRFRSENGRRIPIENLKVEFAQLPNPSVVDILFTLVEISSTLSELSLRLKATANAKILDRVTVDPPVAPERPQDPCPLCFRTAPPPASWGKHKGQHQHNLGNTNNNNHENGDANFENVMIHSESTSTSLSHQQLQQLQNINSNHNIINNLVPNSSSSLAAHQAVGDVISNLGLEKFDTTHQNYLKNKDPPLVIELKINCSCCKGGTIVTNNSKISSDFDKLRRSMMTEEEKEKRRERKQKHKKRRRLQRRRSKRRKNGMEDFSDAESFFDSSCGSDELGDESSFDSADSSSMSSISPSSSSSGRSGNKSRNRRRSERKKQKLLHQQQQAQAGLIVAKKRYEKGKSRSRRGSGEGDLDSEYQPSNYNTTNGNNITSRPSQILLRKNSKNIKKRNNNNSNGKNTNPNDDGDDDDYYDDNDGLGLRADRTLSKKEMKELARELAQEEEKAADVLKSKLLGATSLPGFLRQGSFNLGGGEDSSLVMSSSRIRRKESSMTDYFPSAPPAVASSVHTSSPKIKPYNNNQQQQQQQQQKETKKENYARKQSSTSLLSANRQVSRKYSMFSEYSEKGGAPPSVSGTTRPDSPTSRRASIFSDLSRKNSRANLQRAYSRPDIAGNNNNNNNSGNNLAHRKSTTIKATRSFLGEGGYQDNNNYNNMNETNLIIPTLPSIGNNSGSSKKMELPRALQTTVSGDGGTGFIANARQKYKLFSETRSAKLLFLVGMELNTREEEERQLLSANDPTKNPSDNNSKSNNKSKQSLASKQQQQQQNGNSNYYCWPLELLLQNIHECYEFFLQNGHGKANDLGEFVAGAAAQREKLSVSLKPATMMESCQEHQSDERVNNFVEHVIGHTSCVTLRMILQARDKLRLHQTQKLIDVDTELPAKVQVTKALRVSAETFDFANNVFQSLKEDLLRNCLPRLSATDIQVLLNPVNNNNNNNNNSKSGSAGLKNDANAVLGAALETALADRFVPLHLVHTIWRELLMEQSAMFKDAFLMEVM